MDRTTKILLAAIALGLWANAGLSVLRPAGAQTNLQLAPPAYRKGYAYDLADAVMAIANGLCVNNKLC